MHSDLIIIGAGPGGYETALSAAAPCIFLCNLNFQHFIGMFHPAKQRGNRLPYLEIHRPVLDLQNNVIQKLSV